MTLPLPDNWTLRAKCRFLGHSAQRDLLFPAARATGEIAEAKRYCQGCPVTAECLRDGLGDQHGVRAGLTGDERRRLLDGESARTCLSCQLPFVPRPANPERCTGCSRYSQPQPQPDDYKDEILAMHATGCSGEQISMHFGFSRDQIRGAARRWQVPLMRGYAQDLVAA
jgi:hypothetical protein